MSAAKIGVDDHLAGLPSERRQADLGALVVPLDEWSAGIRPEAPAVELLDAAPATLTRPLALIGGVAHAAT
jgi:hypothetical protein